MASIGTFSGAISYGSSSAPQTVGNSVSSTDAPKKVVQEEAPEAISAASSSALQPDSVEHKAEEMEPGRQEAQGNSKTANEEIKKAVEALNKKMISHSEAVFGIHDETQRVTIKIVDKDTKKVIKELPPEKTLDMLARIWEMAGILVDEKR